MGGTHFQTAAFPSSSRREVESLFQEKDAELQAAGLRSLAARLESRRPELALQIYSALLDSPDLPEAQRRVAHERSEALQGRGSGGVRWESLIGRFSEQATDYRTIVPMMLASSVAGLVKVAAMGRLSSSAASIFSRGLGAKLSSQGLAFAAEVPTFSLSGRALHALGGAPSTTPLGQELAASALSLACLKGFVGMGSKLSPNPILHNILFAPAGLYTAHGLEEKLGWRPASDSASRAADALAASISLSVGARLGGHVLGENFARLQSELRWRGELAARRPLAMSEARFPGFEPLMMTAGDNAGGGPRAGAGGELPVAEAHGKRESFGRGLRQYREYFGFTLLGDLSRNIESRLAASSDPLRILDIGPADAPAIRELKQRFGERLAVESRDQDFLAADLEGRRFDLVLALFGAGDQAPGQLKAVLQKAVDHLDSGGELAALLSSQLLRGPDALNWRKVEDLSATRAGLEHGLALRFEKHPGGHLLYAQRLESGRQIPLQDILGDPRVPPLPAETQGILEKGLRDQTMRAGGHQWRLDASSAARLAQGLAEMGQRNALIVFPNLAQLLMDRFILAFHKDHHRIPAAHEIQKWIDGSEPSALHSKALFVDEWLRLQSERAIEVRKRSNPLPGLLGVGIGLSAFFGDSKAWALDTLHNATDPSLPAYAIPMAAGAIVLGGLLYRHLHRPKVAAKDNVGFKLNSTEGAFFDRILDKQFAGRFNFGSNLGKGASWVLQTLLHFYVGESKSGRDPFHPVGDRLILRAANMDPEYVSRLQPRHQAMLDKVRNRQRSQMDESGSFVWTRNAEPDGSGDEITLPGVPKVLGRTARKGAITLGIGTLTMLSPRAAEASEGFPSHLSLHTSIFDSLQWPTGLQIAAAAAGVLALYKLSRWWRAPKVEVPAFKPRVLPPRIVFVSPENQQDNFRMADVLPFEGLGLDRHEREAAAFDRPVKYGAERPEGWVKSQRREILRVLDKPYLEEWERTLALQKLLTRLTQSIYYNDAEIVDAGKLCWEISTHPRAGLEGRNFFEGAYSAFVNSTFFYPVNSAPIYRESLRLRRIYSDPKVDLPTRLRAATASSWLFHKFDFENPIARGEARMAFESLAEFLNEPEIFRSTREFYTVNSALLLIEGLSNRWIDMNRWIRRMGAEDER